MTLRGRFIAFIGFLAGLASAFGCSNVDYLLNPQSKPSEKVDALVYAEDLREESVDEKHTTSHEKRFEELYPNFDLKGEVENLTEANIEKLINCLKKMPQDSIKKLGNYDIILAMPSDENKEKVNYKDLEQRGHCGYFKNEITFFALDKSSINHEIAGHAIHLTYIDEERAEQVEEIEEKWNNIETIINGEKRKLKDVFGDEDLLGPCNKKGLAVKWKDDKRESRYSFATPDGAGNINEDVATMTDFVMNKDVADTKENYILMDKKAKLLKELGCITDEAYSCWKITNINKFENSDKLLPYLKSKNNSILGVAIYQFHFKKDKQLKYVNEFLSLIKHKDKKIVENALVYFCMNDEYKVYEKQVKDAVKRIGVDLTKMETTIEFRVVNYFAAKAPPKLNKARIKKNAGLQTQTQTQSKSN